MIMKIALFAALLATSPPAAPAMPPLGPQAQPNVIVVLMCIELMLNAVNLTFVTLGRRLGSIDGQTIVFFVLVVAAAEVVVGLSIIVSIMRRRSGVNVDDLAELKG